MNEEASEFRTCKNPCTIFIKIHGLQNDNFMQLYHSINYLAKQMLLKVSAIQFQ